MNIEIKIYDADGRLVLRDVSEAQTATEEQIKEMVSLIENGCPAHIAAALVVPR